MQSELTTRIENISVGNWTTLSRHIFKPFQWILRKHFIQKKGWGAARHDKETIGK